MSGTCTEANATASSPSLNAQERQFLKELRRAKRLGENIGETDPESGKSARINLLDFSEDVYDGFDREIFQGNGALESEIMLVEIESWVQEIQGEIREGDIGWDDVNGIPLELADVQAARSEEAQYMLNRGMFDFRPREESFEKTGRAPILTRWVDTDKGYMEGYKKVRCRTVAKDFKLSLIHI